MSAWIWVATFSSAPMRSFSAVTVVRSWMYSLISSSMVLMASERAWISSPVRMFSLEMAERSSPSSPVEILRTPVEAERPSLVRRSDTYCRAARAT